MFQAAAIARLSRDPDVAPWVTPEHLALTLAFILSVNIMSLKLCWGFKDVAHVQGVPHQGCVVDLELRRRFEDQAFVDPWPFIGDRLTVVIDGAIVEPVRDQDALDRMLADARTAFQPLTLLPA